MHGACSRCRLIGGVGPAPKLGSKFLEESLSSGYKYNRSPVPNKPQGSVLACSVLNFSNIFFGGGTLVNY